MYEQTKRSYHMLTSTISFTVSSNLSALYSAYQTQAQVR